MSSMVSYTPNSRENMGFFKTLVKMSKEVWFYRELIYQLYKRDFLMKYKKSFLGMGWIVFTPLISILSWYFLKSAGVLNPGVATVPYWLFLLFSTTIWGLFKNMVISASRTLLIGQSFINQVYYPHHALLFKQILEELTAFFIVFFLIILLAIATGYKLSWALLLLPILLLPLIVLAASIGLMTSGLNGITKDFEQVLTVVLSLLMFITPVVYKSETKEGIVYFVIKYNPLTYLFGDVRDIAISGKISLSYEFFLLTVLIFAIFPIFLRLFYLAEERIIEKMV